MTRGFTLLEILITISLLLMAFTAGLVAYQKAARNQALDADVAKIVQVLNTAKTNVQSGKKIGCLASTLDTWQVRLESTPPKRVYLYETCIPSSESRSSTYDLSSTISGTTVVFPFKTSITGGPILVTGVNNAKKSINVTGAGEVSVVDVP